jgi:uncharacterized BrkB/YihY/UPF0761 family membrane protein
MLDGVNPYASPRDGGGGAKRELRAPERPWVTRGLAIGLALNLAAVPVFGVLESSSDALRRGGASRLLVQWLEGGCYLTLLWAVYASPVVSLAAMIYTAVADRHTKWWRTKIVLALLTLVLWVAGLYIASQFITYAPP